MSDARILPAQLVQAVEMWVDRELDAAEKYDNREPLDESGIFSLHRLAAEVYAAGFEDGDRAATERHHGERRRAREREAS